MSTEQMSPQMNFFAGAIRAARDGEECSVTLLRQICRGAVEQAPLHELLEIAEGIFRIGQGLNTGKDE